MERATVVQEVQAMVAGTKAAEIREGRAPVAMQVMERVAAGQVVAVVREVEGKATGTVAVAMAAGRAAVAMLVMEGAVVRRVAREAVVRAA